MTDDTQTPATAVEVAEALTVVRAMGATVTAVTIRKMAFELDALRAAAKEAYEPST